MSSFDDNKGFKDRFLSVIKSLGGLRKCSDLVGVSDEQIGKWRDGKSRPPLFAIADLCLNAGVSVDWLLSGVGPRRPAGPTSPDEAAEGHQTPGNSDESFHLVPRLNVEASAGPGALSENEEAFGSLSFRREWLRRRGINPNSAASLTVRGDSMEPTIRDGDTLLLDTSIDHVKDNGIYVVVIDGLVVVKRIHMAHGGSITLISDNQFYPPETIPAPEVQDVRFAGRVMWFGRSI